jgi:hypothetical protein
MPGINVSALNGGDLRRLLKIAHARNEGLLADRLEWEIAARATSLVRAAGAFATLPEDDPEELADSVTAPEAEPFAPGPSARVPPSGRRDVLMATLGAVAGSLLSATIFWGLERTDGLATFVRDGPHPTRAMAVRPAPPGTDQVVAAIAPEPLLRGPVRITPEARAVAPDATPAVEVAKDEGPAKPAIAKAKATSKNEPAPSKRTAAKTQIAAKKEPVLRREALASADRPARPPNLAEWLAKTEPTSH